MKRRLLSKRQGIRLFVAAKQKWHCAQCKDLLNETFELDHVLPLWNGGTEHYSNFQAICATCHRKKSMKERQVYIDHQIELQTGISKYFDPQSFSYLKSDKRSRKPY